MGHTSRSIEDSGAKGDLNSGARISEENINMWLKDHSCDILMKNMTDFCSCPKYLPAAKLKSSRFWQKFPDSLVCCLVISSHTYADL